MTKSSIFSRNQAIDILRALTMTLMVFVNDLWNVAYPKWMGHAGMTEDYFGLSDVVFPCFLFVVGMSIPYALESSFSKGKSGQQVAGHILSRTLALLVMGVFLVNTEGGISPEVGISSSVYKLLLVTSFILIWNTYPRTENTRKGLIFKCLKWVGIALLIFLGIIFLDKGGNMLRPKWWGILGLIGWTYLVCAFIYYFVRDNLKILIPIWGAFVLWCMLRCNFIPTGKPILSLPANHALFAFAGAIHIDTGAHCALTMGGIILSVADIKSRGLSHRQRATGAAIATLALVILGLVSNQFWIVNKIQATIPWVFYSSAAAVGLYALISWAVQYGKEGWFNIIKAAGTATLTCYMIPSIWYCLLDVTGIGTARPEWCNSGVLGVCTCICFSLLCVWTTHLIGKLGIKLKV
jgi:predicted acyltransferase